MSIHEGTLYLRRAVLVATLLGLVALAIPSASALVKCPLGDGTPGNDTIVGDSGPNLICGFQGDDLIYGRAGGDDLYGDPGRDRIYGEEGSDYIGGGDGKDALYGGGGGDVLFGSSGKDSYKGAGGVDCIDAKDDVTGEVVNGGAGDDYASYDGGDVVTSIEHRVPGCKA